MKAHRTLVLTRMLSILVAILFLLPSMTVWGQTTYPATGTILRDSNLRAGPGTSYAVVGAGKPGQQVTITEANSDSSWYHLSTDQWIAAFLVDLANSSVATAVPTAAPDSPNIAIQNVLYDGDVPEVESDEYAVIVNNGTATVNLQGWQLSAGTLDQVFNFPSIEIQPNQTCRVYTNEIHTDSCGLSFGSGSALWNNKGDCGYLYDPSGRHVSTFCYGDITGGTNYTSGPVASVQTTANRSANLRGGPGTNYPVVGGVQGNQALSIISKNAAGDWYQLSDGQWIAAFLVNNAPDDLTTIEQPTITPDPAQMAAPTTTPVPQVSVPTPHPLSGQRRGAICRDGTSSSATGRGACSWHGGVARWLYYP